MHHFPLLPQQARLSLNQRRYLHLPQQVRLFLQVHHFLPLLLKARRNLHLLVLLGQQV